MKLCNLLISAVLAEDWGRMDFDYVPEDTNLYAITSKLFAEKTSGPFDAAKWWQYGWVYNKLSGSKWNNSNFVDLSFTWEISDFIHLSF